MKPTTKTSSIIGLIAVSLFTWTSVAWSDVAASSADATPSAPNAFPVSTLDCGPDQIPTYDGAELSCAATDQALASSYEIAPVGQLIGDLWGLEYVYSVAGGNVDSRTGKGEITLAQGLTANITYAYVNPEFIALTVEFGVFGSAPSSFSGILDATSPGSQIYEGDLVDDFGNGLTFDFPGLQIY